MRTRVLRLPKGGPTTLRLTTLSLDNHHMDSENVVELQSSDVLVTTRVLRSSDIDAVRRLHAELDQHDSYFRFCGPRPKNLQAIASDLSRNDAEHTAIGAFIGERLVGVANYVRSGASTVAEIAMIVAHDVQQHGIGTLLLDRLSERARENGVTTFDAVVLAENARMLRVLRESGRPLALSRDHTTVRARIDLSTRS